MIQLKNYQKEVLYGCDDEGQAGILDISKRILKSKIFQNEILIKAITGSGKTVILGEYINSIYKILEIEPELHNKPIVFIWFSVGTGGLHIQSSNKIKGMLQNTDIKIICPENEDDFNEQKFIDKTLLILNWEKINNTNEKGELISNLLLGEKHNLKSCIEKSNVSFIAIVDEFHRNYDTIAYKQLIKLFNPKIVLGVTATPNNKQSKIVNRHYVQTSKVKEEGMIKIGTIFNENLINIKIDEDKDMMDTILELAIKKRNELEVLYRAEGSNVIPLCLIQLPNKTVDPNMKDNVIKFLSKYNDNGSNFKENEDFTIWLSEQKDNKTIETINENGIKFLIFKQAVAIGWDCPRAHILVKFRPIKKELEAFDLQTIGRVLRTPEHKHYKNQDLNYAYIYAEDKKIEFDNEVKEAFDGASPIYENQKIKDKFIPSIQHAEQFLITQIYDEKKPEDKLIRNKLIDNLKEFCQSKSKNLDYTKISVESFSINSDDLDQIELLDSNSYDKKEIKSSRKIIKNQYLKFIYELSKFDLIKEKDFKIILKQHLTNNLNEVMLGTTDEDIEFSFVELVLSYKISILQAFQETNKEKNISIIRTVKEFKPFVFDKSPKFQSNNPNFGSKNIYVPGVDSGYSDPEKTFIKLLDQNDNVTAWYKNKDKGSHALCVNYQTSHQNKGKTILQDNPTYPDFIVFFKNSDIGIYEIKDLDKQEIVNKDKSLGIVSFLKKLNSENTSIKFHGGLIYINQTTNTIDNSKDFSEI